MTVPLDDLHRAGSMTLEDIAEGRNPAAAVMHRLLLVLLFRLRLKAKRLV